MAEKLPKEFYLRDTHTVAKELLGKYLVRVIDGIFIAGRIIETESYIGATDKACHAYGYKKTLRTKTLFMAGGVSYIYLIYGMYNCMNVITEEEDEPCAVLIRGLEIVSGYDIASRLRYGEEYDKLTKAKLKNMSNGPGKLCKCLNLTRELNERDLTDDDFFITENIDGICNREIRIRCSKRIGIDYAEEAKDFLWRYELY